MKEYLDGLQSDLSQSALGVNPEEDSFAIRKRGPPKRVTEEEKREKNKVIQKRYREKKKQLRLETEKKLEQAVEQLRREQSEFYARKLRLQLLENILKFKGDAVEALETNRSSSFSSRRSRDTVLGTMASSRTIDDADTSLEESSSICVGGMIKSVKEIAVKVSSASSMRQEVTGPESSGDPSDLDLLQVEKALEAMRVAIKSMPKTEESTAIFQDFKPGDLMKYTQEFVKKILGVFDDVNLPLHLVCKDDTPEYDQARKAAVARLLPVYEEYLVVVNIALQHHPKLCIELLPQTTEREFAKQKQKTIEILKDMNVSEEQRDKIRNLRREFLQQQADRLRNVSRHYWQLEDCFEPDQNDSSSGSGMRDMAQQYMTYFDASGVFVEKIAADMQLEHMLRFMRDVGITFTVLQKCVMFAQSYPDFPNVVAVCDAMED